MLTCASKISCRRTCLLQQRKPLRLHCSTKFAKPGGSAQSRHNALYARCYCNKLARSNVCRATGVAEVASPEESELFKTNDGVIEAVDDDEAEVSCIATWSSEPRSIVLPLKRQSPAGRFSWRKHVRELAVSSEGAVRGHCECAWSRAAG